MEYGVDDGVNDGVDDGVDDSVDDSVDDGDLLVETYSRLFDILFLIKIE
jgi:hypothetical protein